MFGTKGVMIKREIDIISVIRSSALTTDSCSLDTPNDKFQNEAICMYCCNREEKMKVALCYSVYCSAFNRYFGSRYNQAELLS